MPRSPLGLAAVAALLETVVVSMVVQKRSVVDIRVPVCKGLSIHCCKPISPPETKAVEASVPKVVFSHACAGSSTVMKYAQQLMNKSDTVSVMDCQGGYEVLADVERGVYGSKDSTYAIQGLAKRASTHGLTLLFKAELNNVRKNANLEKYLKKMQMPTVFMKRWNLLDTLICSVHDCFNMSFRGAGYNVNADCDFRGRNAEAYALSPQVELNATSLLANLEQLKAYHEKTMHYLQRNHFQSAGRASVAMMKFEDLFAFESGGGAASMSVSVDSWRFFLASLGADVRPEAIQAFLEIRANGHSPPRTHRDEIANFDEIKKVIVQDCAKEVNRPAYRTAAWCDHIRSMLRE